MGASQPGQQSVSRKRYSNKPPRVTSSLLAHLIAKALFFVFHRMTTRHPHQIITTRQGLHLAVKNIGAPRPPPAQRARGRGGILPAFHFSSPEVLHLVTSRLQEAFLIEDPRKRSGSERVVVEGA